MFRSHYFDSTARARDTTGYFQHDRDSRPLSQRLDDEEDLQLIRHRKWMQIYRAASLVIAATLLVAWFVSQ